MTRIQLVTLCGNTKRFDSICDTESAFSSIHAFDDYDINVIDLTDKNVWRAKARSFTKNVSCFKELLTIANALKIAKKSKTVVLLPGNVSCQFDYGEAGYNSIESYRKSDRLKNYMTTIVEIVSVLQDVYFELTFSNTKSKIRNYSIESDFVFSKYGSYKPLTFSTMSREATTVDTGKSIYTTLKVKTSEELEELLREADLLDESSNIPDWMEDIEIFDDHEIKENISEHKKIIEEHQEQIAFLKSRLEDHNRYKSILYSNSAELVEVIEEILEKMLKCDLSGFEDKKIEDFSFEHDGDYYIGEIKGISSNVKSSNITQLELHFGSFTDRNPEIDVERIKKLLIINHQRMIPLSERAPIDSKQIELAEKYGSLIIETQTLLKMFEKKRNQQLSTEGCSNLLGNTGLLSL